MQKQDVGHHIGARIGAEGVVGQADRPQQLGPLGQIPAHGGILGIHCIAAGDERHHAARPYLVQRFCEKVIVDVEAQLVVGFVVHLVLTERDIADGKVIEVPPVGGLEARHGDVGFGVKLPGDAPGNAVQLHAVQTAPGHALRQHPEEIAHTAGRFQNVAGAEAHLFYRVVDGANHSRAGVVGVEGRGASSRVFLRGQQLLQLRILGGPRGFVRVKGIRHAAPAHIAGQHFLLCRRSLPGGFLQVFQQLDRRHIGLVLGLGAALAQMVVGDAEVLGVAAQVVPVLLIGRLFGCPLVGESLPLTVHRDGDRVIRLFLRLRVRRRFRRRGFRPVNVQPFHHHVIGKSVFVAGVDRYRLGGDFRCIGFFFLRREQSGVSLILAQPGFKLFPVDDIIAPGIRPGINADRCFFNGINRAGDGVVGCRERYLIARLVGRGPFQGRGVAVCKTFRVLEEAVLLFYIQSPQKRSQFLPSVCQGRKFSLLMVQNLHLNAGGKGAVVRYIPGHKVHRLHAPGI